MMRRGFGLSALLLWLVTASAAGAAGAANVGGVPLPDSVRLTPDGQELVLNGAGERRLFFFRIYTIGLYLPERSKSLPEVLAQKGPKRMQLVILRDEITARQVHKHVIDRIEDGSQPEVMALIRARLDELGRIIHSVRAIERGGTITLDYIPDKGTVIGINGTPRGDPIPGEEFYQALLRLWIGNRARSASLRDALFGLD